MFHVFGFICIWFLICFVEHIVGRGGWRKCLCLILMNIFPTFIFTLFFNDGLNHMMLLLLWCEFECSWKSTIFYGCLIICFGFVGNGFIGRIVRSPAINWLIGLCFSYKHWFFNIPLCSSYASHTAKFIRQATRCLNTHHALIFIVCY